MAGASIRKESQELPQLNIEKLSIEAPGISPELGQRLARLVVDGLTGVRWPKKTASDASLVKATVQAGTANMSLEQMARAIVEEIGRQIG